MKNPTDSLIEAVMEGKRFRLTLWTTENLGHHYRHDAGPFHIRQVFRTRLITLRRTA